jgi:L-Ala-D/L-Glu epimerase
MTEEAPVGRLTRADVYSVDLPLRTPFQHASSGRIDVLREVIVRLESDGGVVGWGEVRGNAHYVTGDTPGRLIAVLREALLPAVLGMPGHTPRLLHRRMSAAVAGNSGAKAAVDMAFHDLLGRALGVPVSQLLGGAQRGEVASDASIPFCPPDEAGSLATRYLEDGFRHLKVRVGLQPFERDVERVGAVRSAIDAHAHGHEVSLAVDANQSWRQKEAIARLRKLAEFDLAWAEQPVAAGDVLGLRAIRRAVDIDIMADESCGTPEDLVRLIRYEAVDRCHFKLVKAGGLLPIVAMMGIAEAAGLPYMVGQMDEGMLATAAAVHAAAVGSTPFGEVWGFQRVGEQPFEGIEVDRGRLVVPSAPGLGVLVDEAALTHLARLEA